MYFSTPVKYAALTLRGAGRVKTSVNIWCL